MNPRALLAMIAATLVAATATALALSVTAASFVALSGLGLIVIGALYPDDGSFSIRTGDDERHRVLLARGADVVSVHDADGESAWVSDSIVTLGWTADEYGKRPLPSYVHPDELERFLDMYEELAATPGRVRRSEFRMRGRDDSWSSIEITMTNCLDEAAIGGIVVNQRDVTPRQLDIEETQRRAARLAGIAELGRIALEGADPDELAAAATQIVARTLDVESCELYRAIDNDDRLALEAACGPSQEFVDQLVLDAAPSSQAGYTMQHGDVVTAHDLKAETRFDLALHEANLGARSGLSTTVSGHSGRYGVIVVQTRGDRVFSADDTTFLQSVGNSLALALERRGVEELARHAALHDPLTGLANRVLFLDRLQHSLSQARRNACHVGVLFVDLDHFKVVNDSLGHGAGDDLLRVVAERLTAIMRPGDMVARFGGDEFTILCERLADEANIEIIAERVRSALEEPFDVEGNRITMTASIGITVGEPARDAAVTADTLLRDADAAMYRAKAGGRARHAVFDDSMRRQALNRLRVESELSAGLERDELRLQYQPIVSVRTGSVVAVEALVRWQHPERGLLEPADFVPIAEETDLVNRLSEWVLDKAARQARIWNRDQARGVLVTVNLSARHLEHGGLVDTVVSTVNETGVNPRWLCLEMTETTVMRDVSESMKTLWQLKELGVCLAIDDFGTGYSSLAYLKRLPVDLLKIDRGFMEGIATSRDDAAIVEAIVRMAHTLGIVTVGEGVEDQGQLMKLRSLGCDLAQGFHLSMPRPAEAVDFQPLLSITALADSTTVPAVQSATHQ